MTRALAIARRDLGSYFHSAIAYVAMTVFLVVTGLLFWRDLEPGAPAGFRSIFEAMVWLLVVVVPVLCMGLLADESASGTIETMMTAPVTDAEVVAGKFLGGFAFLAMLIAPTLLYLVPLRIYAHPDPGPIVAGYIGILLVGALFTAVGLLCSSLTRNQIVAAVSAVSILAAVTVLPWVLKGNVLLASWKARIADAMVFSRYTDFSRGVIDTGNVVFFLAATGVLLFITTKVLESRRWR